MLRKGRIVDQGTPASLLQRYGRSNLEEVFIDIERGDEREPGGGPR
jgi:ABC-2 type transport system ATP-binding protein